MDSIFFLNLLEALSSSVLTVAIGSNIGAILGNKIRLNKLSQYNGKIISDCPLLVKLNSDEIKKQINYKKIEFLRPIIEKLENYISSQNLSTVYKNLQTIKIKWKPFMIMLGVAGTYESKSNTICYSLSSSIGHEALHMASSHYDKNDDIYFIGFKQYKRGFSIGEGINEGYTELLASRIYNKTGKPSAYKIEVKLVKLMEFFFDNPKDMESFYFNFDLPGLIKYLEQFAEKEDIIKLLKEIDKVNFNSSNCLSFLPYYSSIKSQITLYNWMIAHSNN